MAGEIVGHSSVMKLELISIIKKKTAELVNKLMLASLAAWFLH